MMLRDLRTLPGLRFESFAISLRYQAKRETLRHPRSRTMPLRDILLTDEIHLTRVPPLATPNQEAGPAPRHPTDSQEDGVGQTPLEAIAGFARESGN